MVLITDTCEYWDYEGWWSEVTAGCWGAGMREKSTTGRREFLRNCLAGVVAFSSTCGASNSLPPVARSSAKSRVSVAVDPLLRGTSTAATSKRPAGLTDSIRMGKLLDTAIQKLSRINDPRAVWTELTLPGQQVGIKVNALGGRGLATSVLLVETICERLQQAGIRAQDIVIWDRDTAELERAGFHVRVGGNHVQCFGTDRTGFEDDLAIYGSVGSRLSKILTRHCDVVINVPVLKDHDGAGVSMALKNMYGVIHNPNKYHADGCNPYIADVNMLPQIRSKVRLHICDATNACFEGGPAFKPEFTWQANTLIAAGDPVALDTVGWHMIEQKRAEYHLKPLAAENRQPRYLATAADAQHHLGNNDPQRIELIETRLE